MEETRTIECPLIRYHISYDENLTFKDLEDLLHLIRTSNNDVLYKMGISREKGNDLQRIDKITPGSIDLVMALSIIASAITIGEFVSNAKKLIANKIHFRFLQNAFPFTVLLVQLNNPYVYVIPTHHKFVINDIFHKARKFQFSEIQPRIS